jgi:hypothetical protein
LQHLDVKLIKKLAVQRLQQILLENPSLLQNSTNHSLAGCLNDVIKQESSKGMSLPSQLLTKEDIERIARDFTSSPRKEKGDQQKSGDVAGLDHLDFKSKQSLYFRTDEEKAVLMASTVQRTCAYLNIRARAVITPVNLLGQNIR